MSLGSFLAGAGRVASGIRDTQAAERKAEQDAYIVRGQQLASEARNREAAAQAADLKAALDAQRLPDSIDFSGRVGLSPPGQVAAPAAPAAPVAPVARAAPAVRAAPAPAARAAPAPAARAAPAPVAAAPTGGAVDPAKLAAWQAWQKRWVKDTGSDYGAQPAFSKWWKETNRKSGKDVLGSSVVKGVAAAGRGTVKGVTAAGRSVVRGVGAVFGLDAAESETAAAKFVGIAPKPAAAKPAAAKPAAVKPVAGVAVPDTAEFVPAEPAADPAPIAPVTVQQLPSRMVAALGDPEAIAPAMQAYARQRSLMEAQYEAARRRGNLAGMAEIAGQVAALDEQAVEVATAQAVVKFSTTGDTNGLSRVLSYQLGYQMYVEPNAGNTAYNLVGVGSDGKAVVVKADLSSSQVQAYTMWAVSETYRQKQAAADAALAAEARADAREASRDERKHGNELEQIAHKGLVDLMVGTGLSELRIDEALRTGYAEVTTLPEGGFLLRFRGGDTFTVTDGGAIEDANGKDVPVGLIASRLNVGGPGSAPANFPGR